MVDTRPDAAASQVFETWLLRKAQGVAEPFDELVARHPNLRASLEELGRMDAARERALPRAEPAPLAPPPQGRMLGDFRILRKLGEGAMGVVYETEQVSLRRRVALKVLAAHLTLNERALKRFQHEAEITGRLHHRNIVDIHQVGEVEGAHCIVMELIEGTSLERVIERMRREAPGNQPKKRIGDVVEAQGLEDANEAALPPALRQEPRSGRTSGSQKGSSGASNKSYIETALRLISQVADALEHAHRAGVIHRDVKPSNILVRRDGSAVLTDFGLAREEGLPAVSHSGDFVGTPNYVSPEQAMSGRAPVDHRTDVFSLGATLYELLTLQLPFSGDSVHTVLAAIVSKPPRDPAEINPALAPDLVTILLKSLEKDADQRYQSAAELAEDLRAFIDYRPIRARRTPTVVRAWRWVKREPLKAVLAAGLVVGLPLVAGLAVELARSRAALSAAEQPRRLDRGFLALGLGERETAEQLFVEALASDPASVEAMAGRAMALMAQDRAPEAVQILEGFVASAGIVPVLGHLRADALRALGRPEDAATLEAGLSAAEQPLEHFVEAMRLIHQRPFLSGVPRTSLLSLPSGGQGSPEARAPFVWVDAERDSMLQVRERARRAIEHLTIAIEIDPSILYHFARAWAVWLARDEDQARRAADAILRKWPGQPSASFYAGLASEVFDLDRALELYDRALGGDPALDAAINRRASVRLERGEVASALADFQELVRRDPGRASYHGNLAAAWLRADELDEARRSARQALDRDPDYVPAHDVLGTAYFQLHDLEGAEEAFRRAVELEPNGARLRNDHALVLTELGRTGAAETEFRRAIELDPGEPYAHHNLGILLYEAGRFAEAQESFQRVIDGYEKRFHREFPIGEAWGGLGASGMSLGKYEDAVAALEQAVALAPGVEHHANLGVALYELGQLERGIPHLRQALTADPTGIVHACLLTSLTRLGRTEEALVVAHSWTENFAQDPEAWVQRAWLQVDPEGAVGDPADGLASAERALELSDGRSSRLLDTLACALFLAGRKQEAVEAAYRAVELADEQRVDEELRARLAERLEAFEAVMK